ncbi:Tat pathway signal protein [Pseudarthrobacter sp. NamE5]|uniref:Tat pathway signal protein n=1 Tax=Pseudarthrobacter sp. NamE5 TaxID=2576839 RepID=UPI00110A7051|nr:Tat pathway signal protein [Pseudarthrobacter sp. NamE5]TLM85825.1 Tat pathway signal protein [Pseudarthrobacter sp. NamE5]
MDPDKKDPGRDPEHGPAAGDDGPAGQGGQDAGTGSAAKPPPWQVPKPELRPELLNEPITPVDPFARDRERQLDEAAARKKRSQRRTVVVGLGVTALLAGTITAVVASNQDDPEYAQVCFNDETGERVEDASCDSSAGRSGGIYAWYFFSRGAYVPPIGQNRSTAPNYTRTVPSGAKVATGYSTKGGTVSRGGFGTSAKSGTSGGGKVSGG